MLTPRQHILSRERANGRPMANGVQTESDPKHAPDRRWGRVFRTDGCRGVDSFDCGGAVKVTSRKHPQTLKASVFAYLAKIGKDGRSEKDLHRSHRDEQRGRFEGPEKLTIYVNLMSN